MDVRCAVCEEPWDRYGVFNGDMYEWERDLFLAGAGCPCCKGGSSDSEDRPSWERPPDQLLKECECCGVKLKRCVVDKEYYLVHDQIFPAAYNDCLDPALWSSHAGIECVCPDCQVNCSDCEVDLIKDAEPYDGGICYNEHDYRGSFPLCVDCYCNQLDEEEDSE
tara:strand:- start:109 stop:603 length:495 start_codon:yes stop_codon:yes gene_type:complete